MSRRKSREEERAEEEAEFARDEARRQKQSECYHFNCSPVKWYWSGCIEEIYCNDCEATRWFEDKGEQE